MSSILLLLALLSSFSIHTRATAVTETSFEALSIYATAAATTPSCVTECAIVPSAAFKTKYDCDPAYPVGCICGNATRSAELKTSIGQYCYDKCDNKLTELAKSILGDYCVQYKTVQSEPSQTTTSIPSISAQTTESTLTSATQTATTAPKAGGDRITADGRLGGIIGGISVVVAIIGIIVCIILYKRNKRSKNPAGQE